jgi:CheY-like chemotaxis protein
MKTAIHDINDIAHSMATAGISGTEAKTLSLEPVLLSSVVETTASQKRIQYRSRVRVTIEASLQESAYDLFSSVREADLRSVLSNLVNNAVEAIDDAGAISLALGGAGDKCVITVRDNGRGIPYGLLGKLGTEGFTVGKAGGAGIGLHHAKTCARSWGGNLTIESAVGSGTSVTLSLPRSPPPQWFVSSIRVKGATQVIVVDDNPAIHQVWSRRFASIRAAVEGFPPIAHFSSSADFRAARSALPREAEQVLHLVDLEMQQDAETGLDMVRELDIAATSILVTSHYNDPQIKAQCQAIGLGLIPKSVAALVPISCHRLSGEGRPRVYDAVFVDNEDLFRRVWQTAASEHGKTVLLFASIADFYAAQATIDRATPIFLDSDLGDGVAGEHEAKGLYQDLGFRNIYLATAHAPSDFHPVPWLAGIVGKTPPWLRPRTAGARLES